MWLVMEEEEEEGKRKENMAAEVVTFLQWT